MADTKFVPIDGIDIAYHRVEGSAPGLVWLGGYRSDMDGTKAVYLEEMARREGLANLRFDYSGHGESGGEFDDGVISLWARQALAMIVSQTRGPQILIGSSMGAWVALLVNRWLRESGDADRIAAMLLLAPAPDFTTELMEPQLSDDQRSDLAEKGHFDVPTPYGPGPNRFTRRLFEDGAAHRVMNGPIDTFCPVHIIQGKQDPDVPWRHAQKLFELLSKDDATLAFVKDGDHRLSRDRDLAMIDRAVMGLVERIRAQA